MSFPNDRAEVTHSTIASAADFTWKRNVDVTNKIRYIRHDFFDLETKESVDTARALKLAVSLSIFFNNSSLILIVRSQKNVIVLCLCPYRLERNLESAGKTGVHYDQRSH